MWLLTDGVGVHYMGSKAASTAVVFLWNFLARRFALFHGGRGAA
jgi:putative flippase GtrA